MSGAGHERRGCEDIDISSPHLRLGVGRNQECRKVNWMEQEEQTWTVASLHGDASEAVKETLDTVTPASFLSSPSNRRTENHKEREQGGRLWGPSVTCIGKAVKRLIGVVMVCFVLCCVLEEKRF